MKAIVTVIGLDKVGIIAAVCALLAQNRSTSWTSTRPCSRNTSPWTCWWTSPLHRFDARCPTR